MRRAWSVGAGVVLAWGLVTPAAAGTTAPAAGARRSLLPGGKGRAARSVRAVALPGRAPGGVGTLQYDNDVPFQRDGSAFVVGNRFDTGFSNPHSVLSFSFRPGGATGGTFIGGLLDVNPTAMTLNTIALAAITGVPSGTIGTMVFVVPLSSPVVGHTGSFLGAIANYPIGSGCPTNTMLGAPCNGVALTAGTMDPGMGFHGVGANVTSTTGIDIPNQNAVFRVSGDNLPVELMGFGVE